jgi:hypothetical protein
VRSWLGAVLAQCGPGSAPSWPSAGPASVPRLQRSAARNRPSVTSRPSSSMDSNKGGET